MTDPFVSPTGAWTPVSTRLATARMLIGALAGGLLVLVGAVATVLLLPHDLWWLAGVGGVVVGLGVIAWVVWWAPRNQRSWGYAEGDDELTVRGGLMFRRMVTVPYHRLQFVEVEAGPLARRLGFATVTVNTAATLTACAIPGVERGEAMRLRNSLTELGRTHDAGL